MAQNPVKIGKKDRKELCSDLKTIYTAATEAQAETALEVFAQKWNDKYPMISKSWRNHWQNIIPFFDYPPDIRKAISLFMDITPGRRERGGEEPELFVQAACPAPHRTKPSFPSLQPQNDR